MRVRAAAERRNWSADQDIWLSRWYSACPLISVLVLWKMRTEQTQDAFYFVLNSVVFLIRMGMFVVDIASIFLIES